MARPVPVSHLERITGETQARIVALVRRAPLSITALAEAMGLTDNAIRLHIAALTRDGILTEAGVQRDTGGKPARLYGLTKEGEELFPKAYSAVLERVVEELVERDGRDKAIRFLRGVGSHAAADAGVTVPGDLKGRVSVAADVMRALGGDVDVVKTDDGWLLKGHGCPLSAVTANHAEMCALVKGIVEEVTGEKVVECCERGEMPKCRFSVES